MPFRTPVTVGFAVPLDFTWGIALDAELDAEPGTTGAPTRGDATRGEAPKGEAIRRFSMKSCQKSTIGLAMNTDE